MVKIIAPKGQNLTTNLSLARLRWKSLKSIFFLHMGVMIPQTKSQKLPIYLGVYYEI